MDVHKYYAKDTRAVGRGESPLVQLMDSGAVAQRKYVRRQRKVEEGLAREAERMARVVSLPAAAAAGATRTAGLESERLQPWQHTMEGGLQQDAPKRRKKKALNRCHADHGIDSFFSASFSSSSGPSSVPLSSSS
jgi:hypothetical protein